MTSEERWEITLRASPPEMRRLLSETHERLALIDRYMAVRLPNYSFLVDQFVDMAWRSMGRPRTDPPKPYDRPPDAPRPGDPRPQPNESESTFDDYVASEGS